MQRIGIIEDEENISDMIKYNLEKEGYEVFTAYDGEAGLKLIEEGNLDLVLLDIMLPGIDGIDICKKVRQTLDVPIIILSAKADEVDKVIALELGADDYVTKPFSMREVMARIKTRLRKKVNIELSEEAHAELEVPDVFVEDSLVMNLKKYQVTKDDVPVELTRREFELLRFSEEAHAELEVPDVFVEDSLVMNLKKYQVTKDDVPVELTRREFELLRFLWQNKGQVFTREELLNKVWDYDYFGDVRTVDVTVRRLREKIEDNSSKAKYVLTKRGVGYYFKGIDE